MDMSRTIRLIQLEEGCRLRAYKDSRGVWSIAWGFNSEAHGYSPEEAASLVWTQAQADAALHDEVDQVLHQLDQRWPDWRQLDDVRQAAIVSSVYQLGAPGAAKFLATIAALKARDWDKAADQMLASRWAKQTPKRVARNAAMIRSGSWPREVNGEAFALEAADQVPPTAPAQPLPYPVQVAGFGGAEAPSPVPVADVRPPVRVSPVTISKKLALAVIGLLAVILNTPLGLGLNDQQMSDLVKLTSAYILGQAGVDAFAPVVKALIGGKS